MFAVVSISLAVVGWSEARELRPSDHGLAYQYSLPAPGVSSPEIHSMESFFGGSLPFSAPPPHVSDLMLPEAMNTGGARQGDTDSDSGGSGDHVKSVLLVSSLVCGVTGAVLLVAAGLLLVVHFRKTPSTSSSTLSTKQ